MAKTPPKLKVFLCHASKDKPIVRELYDRLRADGFDPWLDSELLDPGENWPLEIQKAMRASQAVIVCLSEVAIVKEGYIHTEIKTAQSLQMEKPEGTIFFIPLQLEECEPPFSMREIQWGKYHEPDGYERLVRALNKRAGQVKAAQGVIKSKGRPRPASGAPLPKSGEGTGNSIQGGDGAVVIGRDVNNSVINVVNIRYENAPVPEQKDASKSASVLVTARSILEKYHLTHPTTLKDLYEMSSSERNDLLRYYQSRAPMPQGDELLALGLFLLVARRYEEALSEISRYMTVEHSAYAEFLSAVALLKGRHPSVLMRDEALAVRSHLRRALELNLQLNQAALFLIFINRECFEKKGFHSQPSLTETERVFHAGFAHPHEFLILNELILGFSTFSQNYIA